MTAVTRTADGERLLRMLLDERAVLQTMYQYSHALDYGDEPSFLECFTDEGIWASTSRWGNQPRRYEGRDGQQRFFRQHTHAPARYHKHLLCDPRITIDGDTAHAESYFVRIDESEPGPWICAFGRYKDTLVRFDDGRWRFRERSIESENGRRPPPI